MTHLEDATMQAELGNNLILIPSANHPPSEKTQYIEIVETKNIFKIVLVWKKGQDKSFNDSVYKIVYRHVEQASNQIR